MYREKRSFFICLLSMLIIFSLAGGVKTAQSQVKYPTKPIDIVVPFSPGGFTDLSNRMVGAYLEKKWGVRFNIINKPGGNTIPALLEVAQAKPDGYTVLGDNVQTPLLPADVKNLPFDIMDRTYVAMLNVQPLLILVPAKSSIKTMKDLEAEIKRNTEAFSWGSTGGVGIVPYTFRQFFSTIGVDIVKTKPVMVGGGADIIGLLAGGHTQASVAPTSTALSALKGGMIRALAITAETRVPSLSEVPTTAESGYPAITAKAWNGITGPAKMPAEIVEIWDKAVREYLKEPETLSKYENATALVSYKNSAEFKEFVRKQIDEAKLLWGVK
jgi:tripartite-type tricarboxylate transporter receptor subunit TctC